MCLAIPGKVLVVHSSDSIMRMATVQFGGLKKEVNLSYVPEAREGDYVLVHVGFAISRLDEREAQRTLEYFRQLGELELVEEDAGNEIP